MDSKFIPFLYANDRISDMLDQYSTSLIKSPDSWTSQKARKALNYWNVVKDNRFMVQRIPLLLNELEELIKEEFPTIDHKTTGRIKDLFSTMNKLELVEADAKSDFKKKFVDSYLKELNPQDKNDSQTLRNAILEDLNSEKKNETKKALHSFYKIHNSTTLKNSNPFDRIRDFFAFRIIVEDSGNGDMIDELYKIANSIIRFVKEDTNFDVLTSTGLTEFSKSTPKSPLVFVPKESGLLKENEELVKDYIFHPKSSGYQSLHISLFDPFTSQSFEFQLRTRSMHIISETDAHHVQYKRSKYAVQQKQSPVDYSKIKLKNNRFRYYKYLNRESNQYQDYIFDNAGLTKPFSYNIHETEELLRFIELW